LKGENTNTVSHDADSASISNFRIVVSFPLFLIDQGSVNHAHLQKDEDFEYKQKVDIPKLEDVRLGSSASGLKSKESVTAFMLGSTESLDGENNAEMALT
jgi:hypothetical protein